MYEIKLSIVIVNYNAKYLLEQCLCSVQAAAAGMDAEVFVIDNHSADGSPAYIRERFPQITLIENEDNHGFAKAGNQAIRLCRGEYVLLLHPDTVIGEESLRTLCCFMDEHPEAGGTGVKMLDGNGVFLPESRRIFLKPKRFAWNVLPYRNAGRQHADILSEAFMFVRHEALDRVGGLDESFFRYGADMDLSYRLAADGWRSHYLPERILHYKSKSARHRDAEYIKAFYGAMLVFCKKYHLCSRLLIRLTTGWKTCCAMLSGTPKKKPPKRRRLLALCREDNFETIKTVCLQQMPELEFVNLWNLDTERVTDAVCRRNQVKSFTDYVFCHPDMRFEQMLLLMDKTENKKAVYHIYNIHGKRLVSPPY
ncbi:dTDP-Rha:alpha-D-GlcNAc-pyrophosphate polyprenol, alpha-3-L-rhamnosyltransferase [Bacteroidales bacterium Barb6]|nr:dTDP-Rha:alpha-D-GlcNAc-pyrophosphate polyprenol, alpha-3-L-rhamnosyltransferase [Bacteroidales bacterium Barb6]